MLVVLAVTLAVIYLVYLWINTKPKNYPPGPVSLPLIGSTFSIPKSYIHFKMMEWQEKYGSLTGLMLGSQPIVAVNGPKAVLEMLRREELQDRPDTFTLRARTFNKRIGETDKGVIGSYISSKMTLGETDKGVIGSYISSKTMLGETDKGVIGSYISSKMTLGETDKGVIGSYISSKTMLCETDKGVIGSYISSKTMLCETDKGVIGSYISSKTMLCETDKGVIGSYISSKTMLCETDKGVIGSYISSKTMLCETDKGVIGSYISSKTMLCETDKGVIGSYISSKTMLCETDKGVIGSYISSKTMLCETDKGVIGSYISSKTMLCETDKGVIGSYISSKMTLGETDKGVIGVFFSDGNVWIKQRKFTVRHLREFGIGKKSMEGIIYEEVENLMKNLKKTKNIQVGGYFNIAVVNVLWAVMAGKRFAHDDKEFVKLTRGLFRMFRAGNAAGGIMDLFPLLRYVAPSLGGYKEMKEATNDIYGFFKVLFKNKVAQWLDNFIIKEIDKTKEKGKINN
uniref:Cytochrome P450 n=1 Tax=Timema poppense TaxID=170557 RepID=A0A7R9D7P4_TIMPO|nr:unnamed protein product [Timema poppensis]